MQRGEAIDDVAGVDCFTGTDGEYLAYTNGDGDEVVVDSPAQVPARYRAVARCVQLKH